MKDASLLLVAAPDIEQQLDTALARECFESHRCQALASALIVMMECPIEAVILDTGLEHFPFDLFLFARDRLKPELARKTIFLVGDETSREHAELMEAQPGVKLWRHAELSDIVFYARVASLSDADADR